MERSLKLNYTKAVAGSSPEHLGISLIYMLSVAFSWILPSSSPITQAASPCPCSSSSLAWAQRSLWPHLRTTLSLALNPQAAVPLLALSSCLPPPSPPSRFSTKIPLLENSPQVLHQALPCPRPRASPEVTALPEHTSAQHGIELICEADCLPSIPGPQGKACLIHGPALVWPASGSVC